MLRAYAFRKSGCPAKQATFGMPAMILEGLEI
jgi:hypothetical protein